MNASSIGVMSEARRRAPASPIGAHSAAQCSSVSISICSRAAVPPIGHGAVRVEPAPACGTGRALRPAQLSGLFGVPGGRDASPQLSWSGTPARRPVRRRRPAAGHGPHRYLITVHALDVDDIGVPADSTPASLGFTLASHILARTTLTGTAETPGDRRAPADVR